jgi:hypothetical protein
MRRVDRPAILATRGVILVSRSARDTYSICALDQPQAPGEVLILKFASLNCEISRLNLRASASL